jgi:hypothetical protein
MSLMIKRGSELIRINTQKNTIEFSTSDGRIWNTRCSSGLYGTFYDLTENGREILSPPRRDCTSATTKDATGTNDKLDIK